MVRKFALLMGAVMLLGACASANANGNTPSDKVACSAVQKEITKATSQLNSAKSDAKNSKGTPGENDANDKVDEANSRLKDLEKRKEECSSEKSTTTTTKPDKPKGKTDKAEVVDTDGTKKILPIIDDGTTVVADSTSDPRTPASLRQEKENGPLKDWMDAYKRLGKFDHYVRGVNDRKALTGFGWEDVKRFGNTKDVEARAIVIFNWPDKTDQQAREDVRQLVGKDADKLVVVRINSCVINTRGFLDHPGMEDFTDCRRMVRASLLPIVYDKDGKPIGLSPRSGIFLDCFNIWRLPRKVERPNPPPPTTPPTTPPVCPWNPALPPDSPFCLAPKDPSREISGDPGSGPGSTPPGGNPGPATPPVTTPTGCNPACVNPTTTTTRPTTTTTTPPSTTPVTGPPPTTIPPPPPSG